MSHILINNLLYGLRIVIQLIDLLFYKKKFLKLLTFSHVTLTLVHYSKNFFILKFSDKVILENTLFISNSINNLLPSLFNEWFLFSSDQHNHETSWSSLGNLHQLSNKTNIYGNNSIVVSAINACNNSQKRLEIYLRGLSPNKIKNILSDVFFVKY